MKTEHLWNQYMQVYDLLTSVDAYNKNLADIARVLQPGPGMKVLDAGSGTGNLSLMLKEAGAKVVSLDFSEQALAIHKQKDPDAQQLCASLESPLPFANGTFDAITCASVLFALSETGCRSAMSEFARVLRPGGRVVVTVPAIEASLYMLIKLHLASLIRKRGALRGGMAAVTSAPHLARVLASNYRIKHLPDWQGYHHFTGDELGAMLQESGLQNVNLDRTYGGCFHIATAMR